MNLDDIPDDSLIRVCIDVSRGWFGFTNGRSLKANWDSKELAHVSSSHQSVPKHLCIATPDGRYLIIHDNTLPEDPVTIRRVWRPPTKPESNIKSTTMATKLPPKKKVGETSTAAPAAVVPKPTPKAAAKATIEVPEGKTPHFYGRARLRSDIGKSASTPELKKAFLDGSKEAESTMEILKLAKKLEIQFVDEDLTAKGYKFLAGHVDGMVTFHAAKAE